jgi:hypothetical protein
MKINNKEGGAAMLVILVFFMFISLAVITGLVSPAVRQYRNARGDYNSKKSYFLAESGMEDAVYRIMNNKTIGSSINLVLGGSSTTTTVTAVGASQKLLNSLGDTSSNQRKVTLTLGQGDGVVFRYGTQAGQGGIIFKNNAFLNGNLYSNGNIVGANNAYITGSAYVAGSSGSISNMRVGTAGTGDAWAHTITGTNATGVIYCQSGSGNNKVCNTSQGDPNILDMPVSDQSILDWEADALAGGTLSGNQTISAPTTLGPKKIVGNLTVNSTLTLANTLWVTGNLTINGTVKLASSFGATSGIVIVEGLINTANNVVFQDSGTVGSYIMLLTTAACDESNLAAPCSGSNAAEIRNNSDIIIINAQNGTVSFANNATVKEVAGKTIRLQNNVGITYGSGLINVGFTSGPAGSWQVTSWKESQ